MNNITITRMDPTATGMTNTTTEVIENRHMYLDNPADDSAAFTEWENVPKSLQTEMALYIQEINQVTSRLQKLIKRTVPGDGSLPPPVGDC